MNRVKKIKGVVEMASKLNAVFLDENFLVIKYGIMAKAQTHP